MHNLQRRFINRFIARVYKLTKSDAFRLWLINLSTKLFVDSKNKIEYDTTNNIFWLKNGNEYLLSVENPNFDFDKTRFDEMAMDFFCQHYIPKTGDIVIDVGAGIGDQSVFFYKKIMKQGKLYNVEASPACFKKLDLLTNKNAYKNCFNHNIAISGRNGKIWMEEQDNYRISKINDQSQGVEICSYTLDNFIRENGISKINFLKVNIEGAEYEMIDGMQESIGIIENLAISCHDFLSNGKDEKIKNKIVKFLAKNNFEIYYGETGDKVLDSWIYGKKTQNN